MSSLAVNKSVIGKEAEHLIRAFSRALSVPLVAVQFSSGLKGAGSSCKIVYVSAARIKRSAEIFERFFIFLIELFPVFLASSGNTSPPARI